MPRPSLLSLWLLSLSLTLLLGCTEKDEDEDEDDEGVGVEIDADGDGSPEGEDCDDADADAFPGNTEICDEIDNNCDGAVDEGVTTTFFSDADGDGFGDASAPVDACENPDGAVTDDTDPAVNPSGDETCNGVDDNCDGTVDEDTALDASTWFADADGDGFGDIGDSTEACDAPDGTVASYTDCDDTDPAVNPSATEICNGVDDDCAAATDESGTVSWQAAGGPLTDVTSSLSGTAASPAAFTAVDEGTLWFCDGTHYVNIDAEAPLTVSSLSGDASLVTLDGGATDSVLYVEQDDADLTINDVTLTNGHSAGRGLFGSSGGGVYCLSETSAGSLTLDGVDVVDNAADIYGGGVFAYGCDVSITDTRIDGNDAEHSGGIVTADATSTAENVEITDNVADSIAGWYQEFGALTATNVLIADNLSSGFGGGFWVFNGELPGAAVVLDEVEVRGNEAEYIAGAGFHSSELTWTGTASTPSGVADNTSDEGGALVLIETTATFTSVDFGTVAGGDDNELADIYLETPERPYRADDDASFSCDDDGCGVEVTGDIADDSGSGTNSLYFLGNTVLADKDATLHSFELYLDPGTSTCTADFHVLSSATGTGTWALEWSSMDQPIASGAGFYPADDIDIITASGTYYALGADIDCTLTYYGGAALGSVTDDMVVGTSEASVYADTSSEITGPIDLSAWDDDTERLYMRITATDL